MARIDSAEKETVKQWSAIEKIETRMNQILGAVVVTLIAAIANLMIKVGG